MLSQDQRTTTAPRTTWQVARQAQARSSNTDASRTPRGTHVQCLDCRGGQAGQGLLPRQGRLQVNSLNPRPHL